MEKSCKTCAHDLGKTDRGGRYCGGNYCDSEYSGWVPKTAVPEHEINEKAPCGRCSHSKNGSPADMQVCPPCLPRTGYKNFLAASDPFGPYSETPTLTGTQKKISEICDEVKTILPKDPINPAHYKAVYACEVIELLQKALTKEQFEGYLKGNMLKYRFRAGYKADREEDLKKSNWYQDRLLEGAHDIQ